MQRSLVANSKTFLDKAKSSGAQKQKQESVCLKRRTQALSYAAKSLRCLLQLARETTHIVQSYTLPDGRVIKVGAERFMAAEIMFRPELVDVETPGISQNVFDCIQVRLWFITCLHLLCKRHLLLPE